MTERSLEHLLDALRSLPKETEWVEFKVNQDEPQLVGELLSAVSNSAALNGQTSGYIAWGIKDATHEVVGTSFQPRKIKIGNEELENWLTTLLNPRVHFWMYELELQGKRCVLFEIEAARYMPVSFKGIEFIRVGSYKKPLSRHPEKERILWRIFEQKSFELSPASPALDLEQIFRLLLWQDYYRMMKQQQPSSLELVAERFLEEKFIERVGKRFNVTQLGALLFALNMADFELLRRKPIRVIFYAGRDRTRTLNEVPGKKGYASGFDALVKFIVSRLPTNEEVRVALRAEVPVYPVIAIRELVANALIHQDLGATGTGPMVEVFADRVEIANPGAPLIDVHRFTDLRQSRNERLAQSMRMLNVCEERGSGIDKVLAAVEAHQLPAPDFQVAGEHTKVVLFSPKDFSQMTKDERIRACYQHAALRAVAGEWMTNESLRARFGLSDSNKSAASRIIADTLAADLIKPFDPR